MREALAEDPGGVGVPEVPLILLCTARRRIQNSQSYIGPIRAEVGVSLQIDETAPCICVPVVPVGVVWGKWRWPAFWKLASHWRRGG